MDDKSVDAVITDPPYGMSWNTNATRFSGGTAESKKKRGTGKDWKKIVENDDKPFDPSPFLKWDKVVMFGYQHFADKLPTGTVLVWIKRLDDAFGSFLSDADLAWSRGGNGVYCFRDQTLMGQTKNRLHPTQKPLSLMTWILVNHTDPHDTVFDPFMGSGTTGVAAVQLGRNFIGCEIDPGYFKIAEKRIHEATLQPSLFTNTEEARQDSLI